MTVAGRSLKSSSVVWLSTSGKLNDRAKVYNSSSQAKKILTKRQITMQVFLSWSTERSRHAASVFRDWLPDVLQSVKPWMSSEDIESGASWNQEIRVALENSHFGILFVTRENWNSSWLMFEAGAIAKQFRSARVVPLIVDAELKPSDLEGPLVQLQARKYEKDSVCRLVQDLNNTCESKVDPNRLLRLFDRQWQDLEAKMSDLPSPHGKVPDRGEHEKIDEILRILRQVSSHGWRASRVAEDRVRLEKIAMLKTLIRQMDRLYYDEAAPIITDNEYDALKAELGELELNP